MKSAKELVEEWLSESVNRTIYEGRDVLMRLKSLSETLTSANEGAQDYIHTWLDKVNTEDYYRKVEIQNRLIDLWAIVTDFQDVLTEESLSGCAS